MDHFVLARLAVAFRWLMLGGIAYSLATGILGMLAPAAAPRAASMASPSTVRAAPDIEAILARNLFGIAGAEAIAGQARENPAIATRLPLELQGVFATEQSGTSAAIIAERGKPGRRYVVGDPVAGGASLAEVRVDHVLLSRKGAREALHFPTRQQGTAVESSTSGSGHTNPADLQNLPYDPGVASEDLSEPDYQEDVSAAEAAPPVYQEPATEDFQSAERDMVDPSVEAE